MGDHDQKAGVQVPAIRRTIRWAVILFIGSALIACAWIAVQSPRFSAASFANVRVGMTRDEVYSLIGDSRYERAILGQLVSPQKITVNFSDNNPELFEQGYRDYMCEVWFSREITGYVYFDRRGVAVSRSTQAGQYSTPLGMIWPKKRDVLQPPLPGKLE